MTKVLDHGYVTLIEHWGSDARIIEAARMSTDGAFRGWGPIKCPEPGCTPIEMPGDLNFCAKCNGTGFIPGDEKLLRYLYTHKHMTPFEQVGATFEIQAPIFVFREWHRHRTQSYNELSARYTEVPDLHYIPTIERLVMDGGSNKQAQGRKVLTEEAALDAQTMLKRAYGVAQAVYEWQLHAGVPRELARLVMPVGRYSRMRASANLRNWLQFIALRDAPDAQWEIQQFAKEVRTQLEAKFPYTLELFKEEQDG